MTREQYNALTMDIAAGGTTMSPIVEEMLLTDEGRKDIKAFITIEQKRHECDIYRHEHRTPVKSDVANYKAYLDIVKDYEREANIPQPTLRKAFFIDKEGIVHNLMKGGSTIG